MSDGWIKIYRQIQDNDIWTGEPFSRGQAWIDLLLLANHKEGLIYVRGNKVKINRGQVAWSQKKLSERWKWSRGKVARFLNDLEEEHQIEQHKNFVTSLVTITKYCDYQKTDSKRTANRQQTEQQTDTNKNVKNVKNEKNIIPYEVAEYLLDSICQWDENHKYNQSKPAIQGWAEDIEKAMRIDGRTREQIEYMIDYLFTKNTETSQFWAPNIQSGYKLREKFDTIKHKIKRELKNGKKTYSDRHNEGKQFLDSYFAEQGDD